MPAPRPPSPAELIAYTKATGKLYTTVHNDEHYFNLTGERVPWYKTPTKKPETAFEQNRREVNEKKILDRRKKPTVEEQEATAITKATGKLDRDAALAEAIAKNRAMIKATEKNRLGESSKSAITRIGKDASTLADEYTGLGAKIDEERLAMDEAANDTILSWWQRNKPYGPDAPKIRATNNARDQFDLGARNVESMQNQRDLVYGAHEAKLDSVDMISRAAANGITNTGPLFEQRRQATEYLDQHEKLLNQRVLETIQQSLGFMPAQEYLMTPKGQQLYEMVAASVKGSVDADLSGGQ